MGTVWQGWSSGPCNSSVEIKHNETMFWMMNANHKSSEATEKKETSLEDHISKNMAHASFNLALGKRRKLSQPYR